MNPENDAAWRRFAATVATADTGAITIDIPGFGKSLDPVTPRPEHDRPRAQWPTATLTEARPHAPAGSLFVPAASAQCWALSEPYRGADVIVIGPATQSDLSRGTGILVPNGVHAWAATLTGTIETTDLLGDLLGEAMTIPVPRAVWLPGTTSEEALTSIGYTAVR